MATVRTVLGEISPDDLGITLPHEHLLLDTSHLFWEEPSAEDPLEIRDVGSRPFPRTTPMCSLRDRTSRGTISG